MGMAAKIASHDDDDDAIHSWTLFSSYNTYSYSTYTLSQIETIKCQPSERKRGRVREWEREETEREEFQYFCARIVKQQEEWKWNGVRSRVVPFTVHAVALSLPLQYRRHRRRSPYMGWNIRNSTHTSRCVYKNCRQAKRVTIDMRHKCGKWCDECASMVLQ